MILMQRKGGIGQIQKKSVRGGEEYEINAKPKSNVLVYVASETHEYIPDTA